MIHTHCVQTPKTGKTDRKGKVTEFILTPSLWGIILLQVMSSYTDKVEHVLSGNL